MIRHTLTLTDVERTDLLHHRDHDLRPYVRERCAAVLKIAAGQSPHAVAHQGLLRPRDPDTVYTWLRRYQTHGLVGLLAYQHGGAHRHCL